jgi:hypothetical protein
MRRLDGVSIQTSVQAYHLNGAEHVTLPERQSEVHVFRGIFAATIGPMVALRSE